MCSVNTNTRIVEWAVGRLTVKISRVSNSVSTQVSVLRPKLSSLLIGDGDFT